METYKTALILGYGRSGRAAEKLLLGEGCETVVLSGETAGDAEVRNELESRQFDVCVVSPGFAIDQPWVCMIRESGVPLLSELELGWSRHQGKTVAVTGSNGKSTAVKWICEMLKTAGLKSEIGGNYGIPACETVLAHPDLDWLVLEVSSFQLETVRTFRADVGILLNILPNHLDRHETMELYRGIKARIFGQSFHPGDACLVPLDLLDDLKGDVREGCRWITFGSVEGADFYFKSGGVFYGSEKVLNLSGTLFDSPVLGGCTGAAVAGAAMACGVSFDAAESSAQAFEPLPHRLRKLGEINGVSYVNDSKATNLAAMSAALQASGNRIRLIAGGLPKEADFTFVKEILAERVRSIYLVGQASRAMYMAWSGVCRCEECGTLEEAFSAARNASEEGDTILLSPACASFDQFASFEERGLMFEKLFDGVKSAWK